jgi:hypothetical protein
LATLDPDLHWFGYLDPDPHWFGYLDPDPGPHWFGYLNPDPHWFGYLDPDPFKPSPLHEVCPDLRPEPVAEHEPDTVLALVLALRRVQQVSMEKINQTRWAIKTKN